MPHIVFVTGDCEYRSEISMPMIARILEAKHGMKTTVCYAMNPETGEKNSTFLTHIDGLEALADADMVVFYTRFRALPDDQVGRILDHVNAGRPIAGLRTSTHAFRYPEGHLHENLNEDFGREVFGQKWIVHHGHESTTDVTVAADRAGHPILRGVEAAFSCASWLYHVEPLNGPCMVLLRGRAVNSNRRDKAEKHPPEQPVAWTREHKGGRVFFTTLGHPADFSETPVRRLLINAVYWGLGMEDQIPASGSEATPVEDYVAPPTH